MSPALTATLTAIAVGMALLAVAVLVWPGTFELGAS